MMYVLIFILGTCIGSFVNVIFTRRDWYKGRSRCDTCGYMLKWYDLVPILSYVLLKGKCRKCGNKIGIEHLVNEMMMGCAFVCISLFYGNNGLEASLIYGTGLFTLCIAAIQDIKEQMVYSWILYTGIILTLGLKTIPQALNGEWDFIIRELLMIAMVRLIFWAISKILYDKIGEGDFDLILIMYIMFGLYDAVLAITIGNIIGCVIYLWPIVVKKYKKDTPVPYAPILFAGAAAVILI